VRAQQCELKPKPGERALQARGDLGDDLLEAAGLDFQPRDEVRKQLDEGLRIAVESPARDDEGLEVVIAHRKGLHLRRGSDAAGHGRDPARDLRVVGAGRAAVGQDAAEEREQVLLLG